MGVEFRAQTVTDSRRFPRTADARAVLFHALGLSALELQDRIRRNVANTFQATGPSPGTLARSIEIGEIQQSAVSMSVPVGPTVIYGRIQELGGDIYPKTAAALHFFVGGKEIFAQHVRIPARPYIKPALDTMRPYVTGQIFRSLMVLLHERGG